MFLGIAHLEKTLTASKNDLTEKSGVNSIWTARVQKHVIIKK